MSVLTRFWFVFEPTPTPSHSNMDCGITAYDQADAERMLRDHVFPWYGSEPRIQKVIADIDVRTLEENHVRPNMGNPAVRGVWWPPLGLP